MSTFTREQLRARAREKVKSLEFSITQTAFADSRAELEEELELARIALASLEAEAVGEVALGEYDDCGCHPDARVVCIAADGQADWENFKDGARLFTTPPTSVVNAEPVSFDALRDAVAEVSGAPAMEWSDIYKGHQPVPFINFNSLARIVDKFRAAPPAPAQSEPIAWLWSHRKHPSEVSLVRPEDDERAEGAHWSGWSCQALYAVPPAPVSVPDENGLLPCPCCGGRAEFDYDDDNLNWISCNVCGISTDTAYHTDVDARDRLRNVWNLRAAMLQGADGNSPVIPAWQAKAEKMAELHGSSFVVFRNGEPPQCADPTKVIISFTDEGLGHGSAEPQQEVKP